MKLIPQDRAGRIRLAVLVGVPSVIALVLVVVMTWMPGHRWSDPLPALTDAQGETALRLHETIRVLTEDIGERNDLAHEGLVAAQLYLQGRLDLLGYVSELETYPIGQREVANVVATLRGTDLASEIIFVGAHYDSVDGTVGADDNASGVAAVLELAERFAATPQRRTVRFVLWVSEEPPHFQTETMGSLVNARRAAERGDNIVAAYSLETIGFYRDHEGSQQYPFPLNLLYPSVGDFVAFVGDLGSRGLVRQSIAAFRAETPFPSEGVATFGSIPGVNWSDHWSYWEVGYRAVMITDTAPFRNPHYHHSTDRLETLDLQRTARVIDGLVDVVEDAANR